MNNVHVKKINNDDSRRIPAGAGTSKEAKFAKRILPYTGVFPIEVLEIPE